MSDNDVNDNPNELLKHPEKITEADINGLAEKAKENLRAKEALKAPRGSDRPDAGQSLGSAGTPSSHVAEGEKPRGKRPLLNHRIDVRVDEDTRRRLAEFGKRNHVFTVADAIRMLILRGLEAEESS